MRKKYSFTPGRKGWKYYDLENPAHFDLIDSDPVLFFKENHEHIIIDEAQISPKLFRALRGVIDADRKKNGRFILTGSASFEIMKNISESLAGRIAIVELSPMKMNELRSEKLSSFYEIFEKKSSSDDLEILKSLKKNKKHNETKISILKGGYPQPVLSGNSDFFLDWMENYFRTYISRDM